MFELHPALAKDTNVVGSFALSLVLLHKDSRYPWVILVPQRPDITEIHHLDLDARQMLMAESCRVAEVMADLFAPKKMNIAALGNLVPQLHVHHVARYETDDAWPHPIWGRGEAKEYEGELLSERLDRLRHALSGESFRVI
jgi:diadenosine tetraphosphate (Ap4A) HIT family hydrolase